MSEARIDIYKWKHKQTGKVLKCVPWWEIPYSDEILRTEMNKITGGRDDRQIKVGFLVQVGWLLENEHGCWFGVGPSAEESFENLGQWTEPKKKRKKKA